MIPPRPQFSVQSTLSKPASTGDFSEGADRPYAKLPPWVSAAACVIGFCAGAVTASAELNIYQVSARQRENDSYISMQSANNTRYFNNADSYPKTDTSNYSRFLSQQPSRTNYSRWIEPPEEPVTHQRTREEYFQETKQHSASGDGEAKLDLADCYYLGWGVATNLAEAYRLYHDVPLSFPRGASMAGAMRYSGIGVAMDQTEGLLLLQRAAGAGEKQASDFLAIVHPSSDQVERSASNNDYRPLLNYAADLWYGKNGREKDTAKALVYLKRGAAAGDKDTTEWLAAVYISPEAVEELKRKSAAGDIDAKLKLANWYYEKKDGTDQSEAAFKLYHEIGAARPYALGQAGYMLVNGQGVAANEGEGLVLLRQAAAAGDKSSAEWLEFRFPTEAGMADLRRRSAAGEKAAKLQLANIYYRDESNTKKAEAYALFREVMDSNPDAEALVGAMLYVGEGVTANETEGLAIEQHAAAHGSKNATRWLADVLPTEEVAEARFAAKDYAPMLAYAADMMRGTHGQIKDQVKAAGYFKRLVAEGYDPALIFLGAAYAAGNGVEEDPTQAEQFMVKADASGSKEAAYHLAILAENETRNHPRDLAAMRKWAEKYLAASASPEAYDLMGRLEYFSDHKDLARGWWLKAVDGGYTFNEHELGYLEWSGSAGPVDEAAGKKHLEEAAARGEELSLYELGVAYKDGLHGMPVDVPKALELFQTAAQKGLPVAQNNMAMAFYTGDGVAQDFEQAAFWAQKAADGGYPNSMYVLGILYLNGNGVTKDLVKSAEWLQKASEKGQAFAMFLLAVDYSQGRGVSADPALAAKWAEKAAENGSKNAVMLMAKFYKDGAGVPKDPAKSVEWMQKAADLGVPDAQAEMADGYDGR